MQGEIARIPTDKHTGQRRGFGFIKGSDGQDYFFHASGMQQTTTPFADLRERDKVEFTPIEGDKGPRAIEVRVL